MGKSTKYEGVLAYLGRPEMIDAIVANKMEEKKQWHDLALGITANMGGERVQSSGATSKMADAINKCVDVEREIDELVDKLIATKKEIISTLEQLDNPTEYRLLHDKYIKYIELKDIAVRHGKDYNWAKQTHWRALGHVQEILDAKQGGEMTDGTD